MIQIAPRVSGPIVTLPIRDNQFVRAGDLLFEIDPRTYQASLDQARATLDQTSGTVEALVKEVESAKAGVEVARASISQAKSERAKVDAFVAKDKAELDRQKESPSQESHLAKSPGQCPGLLRGARWRNRRLRTRDCSRPRRTCLKRRRRWPKPRPSSAPWAKRIRNFGRRSPPSGRPSLTSSSPRCGPQRTDTSPSSASGRQPRRRQSARPGARGHRKLLGGRLLQGKPDRGHQIRRSCGRHPDDLPGRPVTGVVDSIGWGISQKDGSTGTDMLPQVSATFEWIRLAQRIPVRVHLVESRRRSSCAWARPVRCSSGTERAPAEQDERMAPQQ